MAEAKRGPGVLEICSFLLVEGVDESEFRRLASGVNALLARQPGFLGRRLVQAEDGLWTEVVEWSDRQAAAMAGEAFMKDGSTAAFAALIDMTSIRMAHHEIAVAA